MIGNRPLLPFVPLVLAALLLGCTQKNTGDEPAAATDVPTGTSRFLLFPNPIVQNTGGFETNTTAYADAYYRAIDPANSKDTLDKWKTANSFGTSTGTEHLVVFRDTKDLGYGRRMTGRLNTDGSVAFFVENYNVQPNSSGSYASALNVEAAIRRDAQWHVATNAIEWSTTPCINIANGSSFNYDRPNCVGTVKFAKFYSFSAADGTRQLTVDLDGQGQKAMPGPCITCHGGRGDPLTPDEGNPAKPRFPVVESSLSRKRGDVQGRLHGLNVGSFGFSAQAGFTRADQEASLRDFNQWVLCSYPVPGGATVAGICTLPTAGPNEWQGPAAEIIQNWYGGSTTLLGTFSDSPPHVPAGWAGNPSLYTDVVAPYCRTCHMVRGTKNQSDIDFTALGTPAVGVTPATGFLSYADRIKAQVFDRGIMPLALIVYDDFWRSSAPQTLATFLDPLLPVGGKATTASGAALMPGRPIAAPGPNRMVRTGANAILSAENSLFATSYSWTFVNGPASPLITNPTSLIATFLASTPGDYKVNLTVGNGSNTDSKDVTITVDNNFIDPATLRFAHVKNVLQNVLHNGTTKCTTSCHMPPGNNPTPPPVPPIFYNSNFDQDASGAVNATDDDWLLKSVAGRVNLTEIEASPLLREPSGNHHNGGTLFNVTDTTSGGGLSNYSILYNWILGGMQSGGLIANAGPDSTNNLIFAGNPAGSTVSLDGSASVGATSYAWSIVSVNPTTHPNLSPNAATPPSITQPNPALPGATLNVFDIGTYVVRLTAGNGIDPAATDDRTITVTETAVVAQASPSGTQTLTFTPGTPPTAILNLSSAGTLGNPLAYSWSYSAGGLTGPCGTISNANLATATLTVPDSDIGQTCAFRVVASNVSTTNTSAPTTITIAAAAGQNPTASYTATATTRCTMANGTTAAPSAACTWAGNPFNATIGLSGNASGVGTLTYQWSVTSGPAGSSFTNGTSQTATLNIVNDGTYGVRLFVDNGALSTGTIVDKTITVSANSTFAAVVMPVFVNRGCTGCHSGTTPAGVNVGQAPSWANVNDTNGDPLYTRVLARVNLAAPASSLLLLNPLKSTAAPNANGHPGVAIFADENDADYIKFLTWIIGGALNN